MRILLTNTYLLSIALALISNLAFAQKEITNLWDVPKLNGQGVHDQANLFTPETIVELEQKLKSYEDSTSNQIAILTIYQLNAVLESYSSKVAREWKLGQKEKNNGVLILIVKKSREVRIEVGTGLESVLTNKFCSQIIANEIAPHFKEEKYDDGIKAAVDALTKVIGGTYAAKVKINGYQWFMTILSIIVMGASIVGVFSKYYTWAFFGGLLPFYFVAVSASINMWKLGNGWWGLVGYVIAYPLLRFAIVKTKLKQFEFGKNATGGNHEEDLYDKISRTRSRRDLESSRDASDSSSSSDGGSFDGSGSNGRW